MNNENVSYIELLIDIVEVKYTILNKRTKNKVVLFFVE
jgi:hypothetical protein